MASQKEETERERQEKTGASRGAATTGSTAHSRRLSDPKELNPPSEQAGAHVSNTQFRERKLMPHEPGGESETPLSATNTALHPEVGKGGLVFTPSHTCPEPPVTKTTLSELDVPRIVYNPKLRHDVNFDPDLHFRPNLDGESGRRKAQKAMEFWNCLRAHLKLFVSDPVGFERQLAGRPWCLPVTLRAVGEILATLVPPEDRPSVEEMIDVAFLMQQFRRGVADLEKLALWLSKTLKSHCAPMRDDWVDEMAKHLRIGNSSGEVEVIVRGLQSLLGVLEAMKLDVANHQIRCLRPLLIQDTVEFERTFFNKKINSGKILKPPIKKWFDDIRPHGSEAHKPSALNHDAWAFFVGLSSLIFLVEEAEASNKLPESFVFDKERIVKLRSDILDTINLDVCVRLSFTSSFTGNPYLPPTGPPVAPEEDNHVMGLRNARRSPPYISYFGSMPSERIHVVQNLDTSTEDSTDTDSSTSEFDTEDDDSDGSYIRIPKIRSITSTAMTTPLFRSVEVPRDPVRQSILDIVDETPGNNRWQQSVPHLAAQLARQHDLGLLAEIESQLRDRISNPQNEHFKDSKKRVYEALIPLLSTRVNRYFSLSSTELFEIATSPKPPPGQPPKTRHSLPEIAMHLAHIGIIHWRVWADTIYLVENKTCDGNELPTSSTVSDVPGSGSQSQSRDFADGTGAADANSKIVAEI